MTDMICLYCMKFIVERGGKGEYRVCGRCRGRAIASKETVARAIVEVSKYLNNNRFTTVKDVYRLLDSSPTTAELIHAKHFHRGLEVLVNIVEASRSFDGETSAEEHLIIHIHHLQHKS